MTAPLSSASTPKGRILPASAMLVRTGTADAASYSILREYRL
ncbi:MAG TPA: hypothetical protein VFV02_04365 [Acidimicrobiales bacterium]|nr:hypothetical protein [Acidimicrobiales bacterium]